MCVCMCVRTHKRTRTRVHTHKRTRMHAHTLFHSFCLSQPPLSYKVAYYREFFGSPMVRTRGSCKPNHAAQKKKNIQYSIYTFVHLHFFHLSNIYPEDFFMVIYRFHILLFSAMEYSYRGDAVSSTSPIFVDIFSLLLFINTASINIHLSVFWEQNPRSGVARLKDECTYNFARYFTVYFFNVYF